MYKNIELIHMAEHKNCAVKALTTFEYAKSVINTPISVFEFYECCKSYPIIFIKDTNGSWTASVMMGYKEGENSFIDENGVWEKGVYIPATIRRYPFIYVMRDGTTLSLGLDADAKSEAPEDDERKFFDAEGNKTEFLNGVITFMNKLQNDAAVTSGFIAQLDKLGILEEKTATVTTPDQNSYQINSFYAIDEEKLHNLSKKKKKEICEQNLYPLITAHLISLSNFQRFSIK
ncbi:MAG: SapC family protein [Sulfuricurvum sp.]|nr:SapC family protein [Sulfuricurvum sp.]